MKDQAHRMTLAEMIRASADARWVPTYCTAHGRTLPCRDCRPPTISPYVRRALANDLPRNNAAPLVYWPADRTDRP